MVLAAWRRASAAAGRVLACVADDPWLVMRLVAWRASLPLLKRTISVATLARWMWHAPLRGVVRATRMGHVRAILERGGRVLSSTNCLERSLLLYRLFSEAGAPVALVLGTRYIGDRLDGHVWVECDGEPYGEPDACKYLRVVAFGAEGRQLPADANTVSS